MKYTGEPKFKITLKGSDEPVIWRDQKMLFRGKTTLLSILKILEKENPDIDYDWEEL